ncbi:hypothetical protein H4582DRAFT_2086545 [Lactarius indigo]|nr:hypothetical protein H4582DRAFT_2086545 [Lactarius indigo]
MQRIMNTVDDMNRNQLRRELRNWISPPDPSINYNTACGAHTRVPQHGSLEVTPSTVGGLMAACSGSGKSILSSVIIRDIEDVCKGFASMAYFYFDFKDTKAGFPPMYTATFFMTCTPLIVRDHTGQTPIYLILDAVDECVNTSGVLSPREKVLRLVKDLVGLKLSNLHMCITSRPEIDIRNALQPLAAHRISLHDESGQNADIASYVNSVVHSDSRMRRWRAEERDLVVERLSTKADGMFRWVFCQLEILRHCFPSSVLNILDELPKSLDETYERI